MIRMTLCFIATITLGSLGATAARPALAQEVPTGSTMVLGAADSLLNQFVDFLKARGDSVLSVDHRDGRIQAQVQGTSEAVLFQFVSRGDSTAIAAQGSRGGMAALILGLGRVREWLEDEPPSQ